MRTVDSSFSDAIALAKVKMAELFILTLNNGDILRYTNFDKDITWDSDDNVYTALPIERTNINYTTNSESSTVTLKLANISGDLYNLLEANILEGANIKIKRIMWDDTYAVNKEIDVFLGFVNVEFNRKELFLNCKPQVDLMNIRIPKRIYQPSCNSTLYDSECTLSREIHGYDGTATGGSTLTVEDTTRGSVYSATFDAGDEDNPVEIGDSLSGGVGGGTAVCVNIKYATASTGTIWYCELSGSQFVDDETITGGGNTVDINGTPASDSNGYIFGEIEILTGNNAGQRRQVITDSSNTITVMWAFPYAIESGDTYTLYLGCDKTTSVCNSRFNNGNNYSGFHTIPLVQDTMM